MEEPMTAAPDVTAFFDPATATVSYVVADPATKRAAVIDPVLDYDPKAGRTSTASAEALVAAVREKGLTVDWILETHVHADHLSAAPYVKRHLGGRIAIGSRIGTVQATFGKLFDAEPEFATDGRQFDRLFGDGDREPLGDLEIEAMHVPGHTQACAAYRIGDAVFVGDTLFMPDVGTARCDFPGGDARTLWRSIRRILDLPHETRIFVCHDYPPNGSRAPAWETTVAEERRANIHVRDGITEDAFVEMRTARDRTLAMPMLILPSVQVNMRAGDLPPPAANGIRYLKIPLDAV
jgi:glyoxylase-like metal-dependent hydrolase (beta-lactamase superfamily II)